VVTAQRGSDQPLRTPIAITRVTGGALEQAHVASILELGQLAPGFQARMGTITASTQLNIRGIGAAANSAIEPSVAVFIDGAYVPRSGASISTFLDLASVEVLRGPQGTLFGRNASAGALSLHSAEPSGGRDARLAVEAGSGERYRVEGMAEAPLAGVDVRLAGVRQWFGGYWHNALDGQRLGGKDETGGRLALKTGSGELSWVFRADYAEARGDGFANLDLDTSSISPAQLSALRTRLGGILPETDLGSTQVNQYVSSDLADRQRGVVNSLSLALGGSRLTLLSSARSWRNRQLDGDIVWTPLPILSRSTAFDSISHGEELQFTSPRRGWLGGRADLVAGLYYFRERLGIGEGFNLGAQFCNIGAAPGALRDSCNAFLAQDPASGADSTLLRFNQVTHSYAGYAQGNFYFTDRLSLTLGGRLTIDRKRGDFDQTTRTSYALALRAPEALVLPGVDDSNFSYKVRLNYAPDENVLLFGAVTTGFKSGGYNSGGAGVALSTFDQSGNLVSTKRTFAPERVVNYTLGAKGRFLRGQAWGSLVLYRMDVRDYQDRAILGTTFVLRNSGDLRQQGAELEGGLKLGQAFELTGAVAYLDSRFLRFPGASGLPGLGGTQDLTGRRARFSPRWSGNLAARWALTPPGREREWSLAGNMAFVSSQYLGSTTDANPQTIEPGYALLGARLTLADPRAGWGLALFGNNLTNTAYSLGRFNQVLDAALGLRNGVFPGSTAIRRIHGEPRTWGISFSRRWS